MNFDDGLLQEKFDKLKEVLASIPVEKMTAWHKYCDRMKDDEHYPRDVSALFPIC